MTSRRELHRICKAAVPHTAGLAPRFHPASVPALLTPAPICYTYRMNKTPRTALICAAAVALNMLSAHVFYHTLHIPLFFDTIFTVAVVFYCGLFPALAVSVSYNLVNSLLWFLEQGAFDPIFMLYTICGVLIVLSTWLIARRKDDFALGPLVTVLYLVLIAMLSSACTIIVSGVIDFFHLKYYNVPDMMNPIKRFTDSFVRERFHLLAACILAQIPVSFTDRLLTTFAGYGVYRLAARISGRQVA